MPRRKFAEQIRRADYALFVGATLLFLLPSLLCRSTSACPSTKEFMGRGHSISKTPTLSGVILQIPLSKML
jgi:hypothetical protein